jgi:hypothetical protein
MEAHGRIHTTKRRFLCIACTVVSRYSASQATHAGLNGWLSEPCITNTHSPDRRHHQYLELVAVVTLLETKRWKNKCKEQLGLSRRTTYSEHEKLSRSVSILFGRVTHLLSSSSTAVAASAVTPTYRQHAPETHIHTPDSQFSAPTSFRWSFQHALVPTLPYGWCCCTSTTTRRMCRGRGGVVPGTRHGSLLTEGIHWYYWWDHTHDAPTVSPRAAHTTASALAGEEYAPKSQRQRRQRY